LQANRGGANEDYVEVEVVAGGCRIERTGRRKWCGMCLFMKAWGTSEEHNKFTLDQALDVVAAASAVTLMQSEALPHRAGRGCSNRSAPDQGGLARSRMAAPCGRCGVGRSRRPGWLGWEPFDTQPLTEALLGKLLLLSSIRATPVCTAAHRL
jgi:hypothetical protein